MKNDEARAVARKAAKIEYDRCLAVLEQEKRDIDRTHLECPEHVEAYGMWRGRALGLEQAIRALRRANIHPTYRSQEQNGTET